MEDLQNIEGFGFMAVSLGYFDTLMSCSASSTSSEMDDESLVLQASRRDSSDVDRHHRQRRAVGAVRAIADATVWSGASRDTLV